MHLTTGKEPEKNQKASKPQKKDKNSLFIVAEMYCFIHTSQQLLKNYYCPHSIDEETEA